MRDGWITKKIKDLGVIQTGTTPSTKKREFYGNHIPFIKPPDFIPDGSINYQNKGLTKLGLGKARLIKENSILMVCIGATIGKTAITSIPVSCNQQINTFTPSEGLEPRFFYYLLSSSLFYKKVLELSSQATLPMINKSKWQGIEVSFPKSLNEQRQIVALLDQAFAAIDQAKANIERNIENAKELFQSKLNAIFSQKGEGWEEKRLIETNIFIDYRGRTPKKTLEGVRLITAKNVRMGYLKNEPEEFIAVDDYDKWMTRGIPLRGDVLFTTEAPLANVAILNTSEKIALAQRIITLCPNREILSGEYLSYCLQTKSIQDKILEKGTGATVTGIKSKLLKEITIPIAPLSSQDKIVNQLNNYKASIEKILTGYSSKVLAIEELKKSILQKAFSGELTEKATVESELL